MTAEQNRLLEARDPKPPWKKWGPYLSERPNASVFPIGAHAVYSCFLGAILGLNYYPSRDNEADDVADNSDYYLQITTSITMRATTSNAVSIAFMVGP